MATQMSAYASFDARQIGIRVTLCEPDAAVRAQLRAAIENDPLLILVHESQRWSDCEPFLDEIAPELIIARLELIPANWGSRSNDTFRPVVIALRTTLSFPAEECNAIRIPADPHTIKASLDAAVREIYNRKAKQLLFLVDRYVAGSRSSSPYKAFLRVEHEGSAFEVSVKNVISVVAARKYVYIRTTTGEFVLRQPIHQVASVLDPGVFVRIHRSIIINLRHIDQTAPITPRSSFIRLGDGSKYPIGSNCRDRLAEALGAHATQEES